MAQDPIDGNEARAPRCPLSYTSRPETHAEGRRRLHSALGTLLGALRLVCVLGLGVGASSARAGNQDSFFQANEAAITGGAVLAVTHDLGALWYNPAGLGGNQRSKLDLSATAFQYRLRNVPDAIQVWLPDGTFSQAASGRQLLAVPTAFGFVRQIMPRASIAIGAFTSELDTLALRADLSARTPTGTELSQLAEHSTGLTRYHLGVGAGWLAADAVRLGAGVFGVYSALTQRRSFFTHLSTPSALGRLQSTGFGLATRRPTRLSVEASLGLQLRLSHSIQLGLALKSPRALVSEWPRAQNAIFVAQHDPNLPSLAHTAFLSSQPPPQNRGGLLTAGRYHLGIAYAHARGWLSVEGDLSPALANERVQRRSNWNARAGGIFRVDDHLSVGAGAFTDRSVAQRMPDPLGGDVDYYGGTLGAQLRTRVQLPGQQLANEPELVFATTFALRYAVGIGRVTSVLFDLANLEGSLAGPERQVRYHELSLHVGQTLLF